MERERKARLAVRSRFSPHLDEERTGGTAGDRRQTTDEEETESPSGSPQSGRRFRHTLRKRELKVVRYPSGLRLHFLITRSNGKVGLDRTQNFTRSG